MPAAGRGPCRGRQSMTRSGVTMKSTGTSWLVSGITPAGRSWTSCTVVTDTVSGPIRPAAAARANSRSAKPPPLPSRAPSSLAATLPMTTRATGASSARLTRRADLDAPLIEAAFRGGSDRWSGSRAKNGSGSASRGTAMYTVLPSSSARCRTGSCAESGLAFRVLAACHTPVARSRSAAASAPVKFGMRPAAPGNRATRAALISDHTSCRRAALAASTSAGPPASRSWRGTERAIPPSSRKLRAAGALPGLCPPAGRSPQGRPPVQDLAHGRHEAGELAGGEREAERHVATGGDVVPGLEQIEEKQLKELRVAAAQVLQGHHRFRRGVDGEQAADPGHPERCAGRPERPRQFLAQRIAAGGVLLRGLGRVDAGEAGVAGGHRDHVVVEGAGVGQRAGAGRVEQPHDVGAPPEGAERGSAADVLAQRGQVGPDPQPFLQAARP